MHNVPTHQVTEVEVPFEEREKVRAAIEAANQFVSDNYGADDPACYISLTMAGRVLFPIRMDIVGNLLVYIKMCGHGEHHFAGFLGNLREQFRRNGINLGDCKPLELPVV